MDNENKGFQYTYSAKEQAELKRIREKYENREEDKMSRLRRLDASVSKKATTVALILGIIGTLIMGIGMSLVMTDLYQSIGISANLAMILGICIGVAGMIPTVLAYPAYNLVLRKQREKIAPEILRLTEELMK